jgi:hypothetical protein
LIPINTNLQVRHKRDGGCSKLGQLFASTAPLKWSSLVQMVSTAPYKSKLTRERIEAELNRFDSRLNVDEKSNLRRGGKDRLGNLCIPAERCYDVELSLNCTFLD